MGNARVGAQDSNAPLPAGAIADGAIGIAEMGSTASRFSFVTIAGSHTLTTDNIAYNQMLLFTSSASVNLTLPTNASVSLPVGTCVHFAQMGAGQVTVVAASGVTLNSEGGRNKTRAQYAAATLIKVDTNSWLLFGNTNTV